MRLLNFIRTLILDGALCIADVVSIVRLCNRWIHRLRYAVIVEEISLLNCQDRHVKNLFHQHLRIGLGIALDYILRISHINQV